MYSYIQLNKQLAELFSTIEESKVVLNWANIDTTRIAFNPIAIVNWDRILQHTKSTGQLKNLLQVIAQNYDKPQILEYLEEQTPSENNQGYQDASTVARSTMAPEAKPLKQLLKEGAIEKVIKELDNISETQQLSKDFDSAIILLTARNNGLEKKNGAGLMREEDYNIEKQKLISSINYQIDQISKEREIQELLNSIRSTQAPQPPPIFQQETNVQVPGKEELEQLIGGGDIKPIEWLTDAVKTSKFICKVELSDDSAGSGFLLEGGYLLTNQHVVCENYQDLKGLKIDNPTQYSKPKEGRIRLNYHLDNNGEPELTYDLDPQAGYWANPLLDYALIKLKDKESHPLSKWGHAHFNTFHKPKVKDLVSIIQHPGGDEKKIALLKPIVGVWPENNQLFYTVDTLKGSSGSPVFDKNWKVIALHKGGPKTSDTRIRVNAAGDLRIANKGVMIKPILEDIIKQNGPNFMRE
ncbi:MAG: trypsin-like peptidase domain-containing protein [Bacteroidota bacterium]